MKRIKVQPNAIEDIVNDTMDEFILSVQIASITPPDVATMSALVKDVEDILKKYLTVQTL